MSIKRKIKLFWTASIRRQLALGIAIVHAVLMSIFVYDMVGRQTAFLTDQSVQQSTSLARSLAANSVSWVLSSDVIGIEEIVLSQSNYPSLRYAMVTDLNGKVLGYTDRKRVGQYIADEKSLALLNAKAETITLFSSDKLIDIAVPIMSGTRHIGWARVATDRMAIYDSMKIISRNGLFYTFAAILIGILFAVLMSLGMTRDVSRMVSITRGIREGNISLRTNIDRIDELGSLSHNVDQMLDDLEKKYDTLIEKERRMIDFMDVASDWYWETDEKGHFTYLSDRFEDITGLKPELALGRGRSDFTREMVDSEKWQNLFNLIAQHQSFRDFIYKMEHPSIQPLYVSINGKPIFDQMGSCIGYRGVGFDVNARIVAENKIEELKEKEELEGRERMNFLMMMGQKVQEMVAKVIENAQKIAEGRESPHTAGETAVVSISEYGDEINNLMDDGLVYFRIKSGNLNAGNSPVNLNKIIGSVLRELMPVIDEKQISLTVDEGKNLPMIRGDEDHLMRILSNLLKNALKYTPNEGAITIKTWLRKDKAVAFSVEDNGCGMKEDEIPRLLKPFGMELGERSKPAEDKVLDGVIYKPGAGMGLPICQSLLALYDGDLEITSQVSVGTKVTAFIAANHVLQN